MRTYDTEQEAKDALTRADSIFKNMTCPVFKDHCMLSLCHSYFEGDIIEKEGIDISKGGKVHVFFFVRETQCTCSIVTGVVIMEAE